MKTILDKIIRLGTSICKKKKINYLLVDYTLTANNVMFKSIIIHGKTVMDKLPNNLSIDFINAMLQKIARSNNLTTHEIFKMEMLYKEYKQ